MQRQDQKEHWMHKVEGEEREYLASKLAGETRSAKAEQNVFHEIKVVAEEMSGPIMISGPMLHSELKVSSLGTDSLMSSKGVQGLA